MTTENHPTQTLADGDELKTPRPAFVDGNPVMAGAFASFIDWLWRQDWAHEQFIADTGHAPLIKSKSPIDAMVLQSTGFEKAYAGAFVPWAIITHWGTVDDEDRHSA